MTGSEHLRRAFAVDIERVSAKPIASIEDRSVNGNIPEHIGEAEAEGDGGGAASLFD
jgi:hypothetical protein